MKLDLDLDCPPVETYGIKDCERGLSRVRRDLAGGKIVHLVCKSGGPRGGTARHRAWLVPEPDVGYEIRGHLPDGQRINCNLFLKLMGQVLGLVEDGFAVEVRDDVQKATAFYVVYPPPDVLVRHPQVLRFHVMSRTGRLLARSFADATISQARPE